MAPIGMVLGEALSPEVGIISAAVFLILSVIGVALCARCQRKSGNAYEINGAGTGDSTRVATGVNGMADTADTTDVNSTSWRDHKNMPESTLERGKAYTQ